MYAANNAVQVEVKAGESALERLGLEEIHSMLPSQSVTFLALRVLASYVAATQYTRIAIGLGAVQILFEDSLSRKIRAFFLITFLGASALTPVIGIPMGNILLTAIIAYANYKKHPTLFACAATGGALLGAFSVADRIHGLVSSFQGSAGIASTAMSSLLGSVPRREIEDVSYLDDALSNVEAPKPTISGLPEAANVLVSDDKLLEGIMAQRPVMSAGTVLASNIKACKPVLRTVQYISGGTCLVAAALSYKPTLDMVGKGLDVLGETTNMGTYVDEEEDADEQDWMNNLEKDTCLSKTDNPPVEATKTTLGTTVVEYCKTHEKEINAVRNVSGAIFVAATVGATDAFANTVGHVYDRMWG